jgi:hypothetical protein
MIDWRGDFLSAVGTDESNNHAHFIRDFERPVCDKWILDNKRYISDKSKWKELVHGIKIRR